MRKSSNGFNNNEYIEKLNSLCPILQNTIQLIQQDNDFNGSMFIDIINIIKSLDGNYIHKKLNQEIINNLLQQLVTSGEIIIKDNLILVQRGAPRKTLAAVSTTKTNDRQMLETSNRRISFAAIKVFDGHKILSTSDIYNMSDLDFLFSLNGYHLPLTQSTKERSQYENFFSNFLKLVLDDSNSGSQTSSTNINSFKILQECIYICHMTCEMFVNILECILEIIVVINTRIKTIGFTIDISKYNPHLGDPSNVCLDHILANFNDDSKIFAEFKTRKLLNTKSLSLETVTYLSKIEGYNEALIDAITIYNMTADTFMSTLVQLKLSDQCCVSQCTDSCNHLITKLQLFVSEFKTFLAEIREDHGLYKSMYENGNKLLKNLDEMEQKFPVKYGNNSPTNPGTPRSCESTPRSNESTPRMNLIDRNGSGSLSKFISLLSPRFVK